VGVSLVETTFSRACGLGLMCGGFLGPGVCFGTGCGVWARSRASCGMRWADWMSGSGTLDVSSVCDTVVIWARRGRRKVGGSVHLDSRSALRAERASRAIVVVGCDGRTAGGVGEVEVLVRR
jgi:hypothetical protein